MCVNTLKTGVLIFLSLLFFTIITGCVEVTPPSGQQETGSYGMETGGDMKDLVKNQQTTSPGQEAANTSDVQKTGDQQNTDNPTPPLPNESFIQVTPMSYDELQNDESVSYLKYNRPVSTTERQYITIHNMTNQLFSKNASAYAYELITPPLYIDLGFIPKMVTDEQEVYKRTGDKEGTIVYTKTRPSQDAWFEMRVYDTTTNQEILREGYGKTYSQTNKSAAVRRAGKYQFDFMGDAIWVNITMKIPVDSSTLSLYSNVSDLIEDQKKRETLMPSVFLQDKDLGQGWQKIGDEIHSTTKYSSVYNIPSTGLKLSQDITRYSSSKEIDEAYLATKENNKAESQVSIITGDEGYGFESIRKTGIVFKDNLYLVELTSYSVPPVSLNELKRYSSLISDRISKI